MKRLVAALLVALLLLGLAACGGSANVTLADSLGRQVALEGLPARVVDMVPGDVEILYAIGAQDLLVGVGEFCNYPAEALELPSLGTGANTSVEQIIALEPDLVIMGTMAQDAAHVEALEAAGIPVMISAATTIEQTYEIIEKLGTITDKAEAAAQLVADMKAQFDALAALTSGAEKKSAYIEISPLQYGLWTCGANTFSDELLTAAGLTNIFADLEGWPEISEEQVISRDPALIFTTTLPYDGFDPIAEIAGRAGWDTMAAVAGGQIFAVDPDASNRPGPRLAQAAEELYHLAYDPQ